MSGVIRVPTPVNEPVLSYAPGSTERAALSARLDELSAERMDIPLIIGGEEVRTGRTSRAVMPHDHGHVLADWHMAGPAEVARAIAASRAAWETWSVTPWEDRAAVFLRAAELLAGPWRATLNAATMLGQSKTAHQAEIDSACELIDFFRFNPWFAERVYGDQPISGPGVWNRSEYRPLEGFVYAVSPFNFTAIAGNLCGAPALMGNVVLWKPSSTAVYSGYWLMRLLEAAGLPPGVVNFLPGEPAAVTDALIGHRDFAGLHYTGSTRVFQDLWKRMADGLGSYRGYPRIVGETGGKDFIVAHPSADVDVLRTALVRGAFEYQGQKCSAASRAYVPRSVWARLRDDLVGVTESLPMGDVTDFANFMGAVIDRKSFSKLSGVIDRVDDDPALSVVAGGQADDREGFFVRPTVIEGTDPGHEVFTTEYFGPILAVHVYDDADYDTVLTQMESAAPYALTGAVIAEDRAAIAHAQRFLRFAAGNFYVNDKPTGAVVGQQPFGGGRASGTNDKAGAAQNLQRWTSTRSIKETFVPAKDHRYPHMG